MNCQVCNTYQKVRRKKEEPDESLKQMIAEGKLRPCPKCKMLTMKEFGVCNVVREEKQIGCCFVVEVDVQLLLLVVSC